jgi:hypothetical protein
MEQVQKKGMSKGCLVALIIVGALLLIVVIGALSCWFYRVELARMGAVTMMNQVKQMVAENPPQDMDTAQFNSLVDGFVGRLEEDEIADKDTSLMKMAEFMQVMQGVVEDKAVDESDIDQLRNTMVSFYPELADIYQRVEPSDSSVVTDSM